MNLAKSLHKKFMRRFSVINIQMTKKETLKIQLKDFQEKTAGAIIERMPSKKFYGGYYRSYYKYPNLQMDLQAFRYYSWTNYDIPDFLVTDKYSVTEPSTFRWDDFIDDELSY